jgi:hypothetical protein
MMEQFVERHAEDTAIHGRHPFEAPVFGAVSDQTIELFQVLDRDETEFPFTESRLFEDLETGVRRVVTPAAARESYLARFNAFMEAHREMFRSLEMTHCVVRTDENPWRALALFLAGCASAGRRAQPDAVDRLRALDQSVSEAERVWAEAIDDPWTEPELMRRYFEMQDICRECARRRSGFATIEEKRLCERVREPFKIYFNHLCVRVNGLEEQIAITEKPGAEKQATVAYE